MRMHASGMKVATLDLPLKEVGFQRASPLAGLKGRASARLRHDALRLATDHSNCRFWDQSRVLPEVGNVRVAPCFSRVASEFRPGQIGLKFGEQFARCQNLPVQKHPGQAYGLPRDDQKALIRTLVSNTTRSAFISKQPLQLIVGQAACRCLGLTSGKCLEQPRLGSRRRRLASSSPDHAPGRWR